jgi:rod shape-determining protein MreD
MADPTSARRWIGQVIFPALLLGVAIAQLLPLSTMPVRFPMPDLMLCMTCLWVARRPDLVPVWMVAVAFFLADIFFQRPPGLMTAIVVLLTEALRRRASTLRSLSFFAEWTTVGGGIVALMVINRAILALVLADQAPLGPTLFQTAATIAVYPVVAGLTFLVLGIGRPGLGEVDAFGRPL